MFHGFSETFLCFIVYAFIGWICECIFCSVLQKRAVNRGMLKGPYCPIYGLGALFILAAAEPFRENPVLVFFVALAVTSALEYFASWLLEKLFKMRWWDYSDQRFQLNGRICLPLSIAFGVMGWVLVYGIHPVTVWVAGLIPDSVRTLVANVLMAVFLIDLVSTVGGIMGVSQRLEQLQSLLVELKKHDGHAWLDAKDWKGSLGRLREMGEREGQAVREETLKLLERVNVLSGELEAFLKRHPSLIAGQWREAAGVVRENAVRRIHPHQEAARKRLHQVRTGVVGAGKTAGKSFVARFHYYDLFWVFLIAGVIGYLVETLFCLVTTGTIESRQGVLYGPFNQVYGFGAVLMVLLLEPLRQKNDRWLFLGSALLGGAFEIVCSLIQEAAFGSVSWDYEGEMFAVAGGRTSLLFMFFWGILGVWFIKGVLPRLNRLVARIPRKQGVPLTILLTVLLCVDLLLSGMAVDRWSERANGEAAHSACDEWLDRSYPDDYMEQVYPNLMMQIE